MRESATPIYVGHHNITTATEEVQSRSSRCECMHCGDVVCECDIASISDYMKLAESRRRIYRPLPLDEFGATLPYARNLGQDLPMYEMTEEGTIQKMPDEGIQFLCRWIGSLAGYDPHLLNENRAEQGVVHPSLLPRPANLPLLCQNLRSADARSSVQSCPFMRRRDTAGSKSVHSIATLPQLDSK